MNKIMSKHYKEFLITAEPFITEILTSVLWNLDIEGISEEVNCIKVFTKNLNLSQDEIENELDKLVENNLVRNFEVQENILVERNWNEDWEKSREVIKVTDKIIIKPTFKEYKPKENEIVIILDPKMSFGTGEHPTTKICIKLLEKYLSQNDKVLDVGSGTGILSIAAAKLGAKKVIAFDVDEWAYENGLENIKMNNVESIVEIKKCEIDEISDNDFDLIVANIQRNILLELSSEISARLKNKGKLILSGLLEVDEEVILNNYILLGFEFIERYKMDDWIGIVFIKSGTV